MAYALIRNDAIEQIGHLPRVWYDGIRWWDFRIDAPDPSTGWHRVVETAQPADTATHTHNWSVELVAGVPTVVWIARPWTPDELAAQAAAANAATLRADPQAQIDALLASIAALQAITDRTNAAINNNGNPAPAIKDVAREVMTVARRVVRLTRLQLDALNSTTGV